MRTSLIFIIENLLRGECFKFRREDFVENWNFTALSKTTRGEFPLRRVRERQRGGRVRVRIRLYGTAEVSESARTSTDVVRLVLRGRPRFVGFMTGMKWFLAGRSSRRYLRHGAPGGGGRERGSSFAGAERKA